MSATGWGATFNVSVEDNVFVPDVLNISVGDTVVWTQNGGDHDVLSDGGTFGSGDLIPFGMTYRFTFTAPGAFGYYCSLHGAAGSGMFGTVNVSGSAVNHPPATPMNQLLANNATNQPLAIALQSSAFSDSDAGSSLAASQWLVRRAADDQMIFDSGETSTSKTNLILGLGTLNYGTAYRWQVRYKDDAGAWSDYSTATAFTTVLPPLTATRSGTALVLSWPTNTAGFLLEYATNLTSIGWTSAPAPAVVGNVNVVTNNSPDPARFYRLKK